MVKSALLPKPDLQMTKPLPASTPPPVIFAQRKATLPGQGETMVTAPRDAGETLAPPVRKDMERGFGNDFSTVRIHDDAAAHDSARAINARAYTAGNNIVFGEGAYRPESKGGRALLAHELAHTLQQNGVQMKSNEPLPTAFDSELEREADRAALAVTSGRSAGAMTRVDRPTVFKAESDPPAGTSADTVESASPADDGAPTAPPPDIPADVEVIEETPSGPGATRLVVQMGALKLPRVKGKGEWVEQAYKSRASGGGLIFTPKFKGGSYGTAKSIAAYAEKPGEKYKNVWLNNYGFKTLRGMATAFKEAATRENADPEVKAAYEDEGAKYIIDRYTRSNYLTVGKCDIDHIVEKQLKGTSTPGNLQLLVSDKNQESGRETYKYLKSETERVLSPNRKNVVDFQMRFNDVQLVADDSDGSYIVEKTLRSGKVKGSDEVAASAGGTAILLEAGGNREVVYGRKGETTGIDMGDRRLIPGMKLKTYQRARNSSARGGIDTVKAILASKPLIPGSKDITLLATVTKAPVESDGSAGKSGEKKAAASEFRKLKLHPSANQNLPFHYPYLSPGYFRKLAVDENQNLTGEGVIKPSIKFLGDLKVRFGPDQLDLVQDIDVATLNKTAYMRRLAGYFRFTDGNLAIDLVNFNPSGKLGFSVGPGRKPVMTGAITSTVEGGNFIARGTLVPSSDLPGIEAAEGNVTFNSQDGWSGEVKASSTKLPRSTVDAKLGFREKKGVFKPYAEGGITTTLVRDQELKLGMRWSGSNVAYYGRVTIPKPMPRVKQVTLSGAYNGKNLRLSGEADFKWKSINAKMNIGYIWKEGEEDGKFFGKAKVDLKAGRLDGSISLGFNEKGHYWGEGTASYLITDHVRPTLKVTLERGGKVKLGGKVQINDYPLSRQWPKKGGADNLLFDFKTPKFSAPTPIPGVTAYVRFGAGMGVRYGVGPVMLTKAVFEGSLYPLEDDLNIRARLYGKVVAPAFGELYGKLSASIGAEVAYGAAGARGTLTMYPSLGIKSAAVAEVEATYSSEAFKFDLKAYAEGNFYVTLSIDLTGTIYAFYELVKHDWTWNVGKYSATLGPKLRVDFGSMGYDSEKGIKWPSLSNIDFSPKSFEPMDMVRDMLGKSKAKES